MHEGLSLDDVLLTPRKSNIKSRLDTDLNTNVTEHYQMKIPIISTPMPNVTEIKMIEAMHEAGGLGIVHRFMGKTHRFNTVGYVKSEGYDINAASIGLGELEKGIVDRLIEYGANLIFIDVAHAHTNNMIDYIKKIKDRFPSIELMAGNVATYEGMRDLVRAGANAVRVGIGGGYGCSTRTVTGHGVPNLTALLDTVKYRNEFKEDTGRYIPIVLDGGIKTSGDIVKALAFGADTVSLGYMLAGTSATPPELIMIDGKPYKNYYGMASVEAQNKHRGGLKQGTAPEGVSRLVPYEGNTESILEKIVGGVRSGLTYSGAKTIYELRKNAQPILLSSGALIESKMV